MLFLPYWYIFLLAEILSMAIFQFDIPVYFIFFLKSVFVCFTIFAREFPFSDSHLLQLSHMCPGWEWQPCGANFMVASIKASQASRF